MLVQVSLPPSVAANSVKLTAGDRDVTTDFRAGMIPGTLMGLVSGLPNGVTVLKAEAKAKGVAPSASLEITNYPITGPVFSGPWMQPFICRNRSLQALPGRRRCSGPAARCGNCSARTVVQYVYWPKADPGVTAPPAFKPLPDPATVPDDVAMTTTSTGATVRFIVRVETGTMNRGIYQNAILFDPATDASPSPWAQPKGWNKRLIAIHGAGCPSGWYIQGPAEGVNVLDKEHLAQGYALFINTLNHPTNSCNAILAGETSMMGKEHFIEEFGVPFHTWTTGRSGGAYTSLDVADAFPGLFDGVNIGATFPDALAIAMSGLDAHLLMHYFTVTNPDGFTDVAAEESAIGGYEGVPAMIDAANQAQRTDPVPDRQDIEGYQSARWNAATALATAYRRTAPPHLRRRGTAAAATMPAIAAAMTR